MALETDATILNENNGLSAIFRGVHDMRPKKAQPVLPVALISTTAKNTLLFRFFGQQQTLTFGFTIVDDGTDISSGTHSSTVITVDQQIQYLTENFFTDEFDTLWTVTQSRIYSTTIRGVIINLEFDLVAGFVSIVTGTLSFQRGRLVPFI